MKYNKNNNSSEKLLAPDASNPKQKTVSLTRSATHQNSERIDHFLLFKGSIQSRYLFGFFLFVLIVSPGQKHLESIHVQ